MSTKKVLSLPTWREPTFWGLQVFSVTSVDLRKGQNMEAYVRSVWSETADWSRVEEETGGHGGPGLSYYICPSRFGMQSLKDVLRLLEEKEAGFG